MGFPTLDKFLFVFELETGGIILGWLSAVAAGLGTILLITFFVLTCFGLLKGDERKISTKPTLHVLNINLISSSCQCGVRYLYSLLLLGSLRINSAHQRNK